MKTRIIHTKVWKDQFFSNLSLSSKMFFLYLISNEHINLTAAYECPNRIIAFDTGLTHEQIEQGKEDLETKFVFEKDWVYIKNAEKYNSYCNNWKQAIAYRREYNLLPSFMQKYVKTIEDIQNIIKEKNDTTIIPVSYPYDTDYKSKTKNNKSKTKNSIPVSYNHKDPKYHMIKGDKENINI